jgi:hypothetical protein
MNTNYQTRMKGLAAGLLLTTMMSSFIMAAGRPHKDKDGVSNETMKTFAADFPGASNVDWISNDKGQTYVAHFQLYNIRTVAQFDNNGELISTLRYYGKERLTPAIRTELQGKYPNRSIEGITELSQNDDITYYVKMQDQSHWYTVTVNDGTMEQTEKIDK